MGRRRWDGDGSVKEQEGQWGEGRRAGGWGGGCVRATEVSGRTERAGGGAGGEMAQRDGCSDGLMLWIRLEMIGVCHNVEDNLAKRQILFEISVGLSVFLKIEALLIQDWNEFSFCKLVACERHELLHQLAFILHTPGAKRRAK